MYRIDAICWYVQCEHRKVPWDEMSSGMDEGDYQCDLETIHAHKGPWEYSEHLPLACPYREAHAVEQPCPRKKKQ